MTDEMEHPRPAAGPPAEPAPLAPPPRSSALALVLWLTAICGGLAVLLLVVAHMSAAGGCGGG